MTIKVRKKRNHRIVVNITTEQRNEYLELAETLGLTNLVNLTRFALVSLKKNEKKAG